MIGNRETIPHYQSDFYRDSYYKLLRVTMVAMMINLFLILGIIYFVIFTQPQKYYASTTTGEIIALKPNVQRSR